MSETGFDWPALMQVGFQHLGLEPQAFWRLTPAEFLMLTGQNHIAVPMARARLEELAAQFPDMIRKDVGNGTNG